MKAHELAYKLLQMKDLEVTVSIYSSEYGDNDVYTIKDCCEGDSSIYLSKEYSHSFKVTPEDTNDPNEQVLVPEKYIK